MAAKGGSCKCCKDALTNASKFSKLMGSKDDKQLTQSANSRMVKDVWVKDYQKGYDIKAICEGSVFPACMTDRAKKCMAISEDKMGEYLERAAHEVAKKKALKAKKPAPKKEDPEVETIRADLERLLVASEPDVKGTAISKTGGVAKMTDTSKYTGAHKGRFDAEGKGKGEAGRVDKVEHTGYVGEYKNKDTFDKKH